MKSKLYIGVMSGTSMDSMDAALVKIENNSWSIINSARREFTPSLREQLLIVSRENQNISLKDFIVINAKTGIEFSKCINQLIEHQGWKTPQVCTTREAELEAAQQRVAIADVSSNGKIMVQGDQAHSFAV